MKKIIFIIMLLVTYQHTIAKPTEHQSKNSISCNTNVGEIVKITKSQMLDYGKACTSDTNSGVSNFVWEQMLVQQKEHLRDPANQQKMKRIISQKAHAIVIKQKMCQIHPL
jgi:hypothetical protein